MPQNHMAPQFFTTSPGEPRLAYLSRAGLRGPGLFWLGGYRSDMRGSKATFVDAFAAEQDRPCLRFDYSGHGESEGAFEDGTIGLWAEQAAKIFRALTEGPQVVIGSSMGGWIALLLARALAKLGETDRLASLVLIAPAPDFSEELVWPQPPRNGARDAGARRGVARRPKCLHPRIFRRRPPTVGVGRRAAHMVSCPHSPGDAGRRRAVAPRPETAGASRRRSGDPHPDSRRRPPALPPAGSRSPARGADANACGAIKCSLRLRWCSRRRRRRGLASPPGVRLRRCEEWHVWPKSIA